MFFVLLLLLVAVMYSLWEDHLRHGL